MKNYFVFEYLYRDANNFKAFGELLLFGTVSNDYDTELKSCLYSGELFVAEQVNIPTLYSQLWAFSDGPTISDHAFHEFSLLRLATDKDVLSLALWGELTHLIDAFQMASQQSWDCSLSVHCAVI